MKTASKITARFAGMPMFESRRRSFGDQRRFVAWAVGSYVGGGQEWRVAKEFPVGTSEPEAFRAFEPTIERAINS